MDKKEMILTKIKILIPNQDNDGYDSILDFVVDKVLQDVANYIHVDGVIDIPDALNMAIVGLCTQYIETHQLLVPLADKTGGIASLSEGDASVTFKTTASIYAELQATNTITDNYLAQLNGFRRVKQ